MIDDDDEEFIGVSCGNRSIESRLALGSIV